MTGIDDAASAFDADMGGSTHVSSATGSDAPVEQLFRGVGDLENPNEAAGGDVVKATGERRCVARPGQRRPGVR